jgi:hypothetical protein
MSGKCWVCKRQAIHRRRSALDSLYTLARENGCLGSDTVGVIAVEVTK